MKIGYFADGPWSHKALEKILQDKDHEVCFIVPRFDSQDPILKDMAFEYNIDFLPMENVNDSASIKKLGHYKSDIYISMSFNQILKREILQSCEKGFINCHAGALPFYRGRNILNWALINDEKEFGVTVHHVDEGIDTGDIIIQKMVEINDSDNYASLLDKATIVCSELLYEAILDIAAGKANRIPQDTIHPVGFYCCRRKEGDEWINWNWSSRRIFNFVRAITHPGPCARTGFNGEIISVPRAELICDAPSYIGVPGEVTFKGSNFFDVKTGDTTLKIFPQKLEKDIFKDLRIGSRLGEAI